MREGPDGLRVVTPFAVGLIIFDSSDHVSQVAPIFGYMLGWSWTRVQQYCGRRGWDIEAI